jgi:hypothetical protein
VLRHRIHPLAEEQRCSSVLDRDISDEGGSAVKPHAHPTHNRRRSIVKATRTLLMIAMVISSASLMAQVVEVQAKPLSDTDVKLLRQDLQAAKNEVVRHTMQFTAKENDAFWPVYSEYTAAQHAIAQKRFEVIKEYAQNLTKMDDQTASDMTRRMLQVDADTLKLRNEYLSRFEKALGQKQAAKFYQVDNRLTMMIDVQLASEIPLIP